MKIVQPFGFTESFEEYAGRCKAACNCSRSRRYDAAGNPLPTFELPHRGHDEHCVLWDAYKAWKANNQRLWELIRSEKSFSQAS